MKYKNMIFQNLKLISNTYIFKVLLGTSIIINIIYSVSTLFNNISYDYITSVYYIVTNNFYIIFLILMMIINTLNTIDNFDKNLIYIIRFKTKTNYYIELIKNIICSNFLLYIMNLMILIIMSNVIFGSTFNVINWENYNILNILYIIYHFIKVIFITEELMILFYIIKKLFGKIGIGLYFIILIFPLFTSYSFEVVSNISNMHIFPIYYIANAYYSSFELELCIFIVYFLIFLILLIVLFQLLKYKMGGVLDDK